MPFSLTIAEGKGRGTRFRFAGDRVSVGRGAENDVVLNDAGVSRAHARIERRGKAWVLIDRGSANGTQLNGAGVSVAAALRDGDRIRVGNVTFEFRALADAAPPRIRSRRWAKGWWKRMQPPERAGLIAGCALVAMAGSGAASWGVTPAVAGAVAEEPVKVSRCAESGMAGSGSPGAARAAYERGRRKLDDRRIAPRNLYDAWAAFGQARAHLESAAGEPLRDEVARLLAECERELEAQCGRLSFKASRFERYGEEDKARQAWREVLLHFPGDDPSSCRKKARNSLVSSQQDVGGE